MKRIDKITNDIIHTKDPIDSTIFRPNLSTIYPENIADIKRTNETPIENILP